MIYSYFVEIKKIKFFVEISFKNRKYYCSGVAMMTMQ